MPPTIRLVSERTAEGRVRDIFEEIKAGLGTSFVPANFRAAAHNPDHLDTYWQQYKAIMHGGSVDSATKEIVAMVVSALNRCDA
jgi:alkylhydroperoxidase family enzyme